MSTKNHPARQIVKAIKTLSGLNVLEMIERDYINLDVVIKDFPPERWNVTLHESGERKIGAIKILRAPRGITIRDLLTAKDIVDRVDAGTPEVVFSVKDKGEARSIVQMLTDNGSSATLDPEY